MIRRVEWKETTEKEGQERRHVLAYGQKTKKDEKQIRWEHKLGEEVGKEHNTFSTYIVYAGRLHVGDLS